MWGKGSAQDSSALPLPSYNALKLPSPILCNRILASLSAEKGSGLLGAPPPQVFTAKYPSAPWSLLGRGLVPVPSAAGSVLCLGRGPHCRSRWGSKLLEGSPLDQSCLQPKVKGQGQLAGHLLEAGCLARPALPGFSGVPPFSPLWRSFL